MSEYKKHWLNGQQMEGFKPCPFCGELPYIRVEPQEAYGVWLTKPVPIESVWVRLVCDHFGGQIRYSENRAVYVHGRNIGDPITYVRTVEEASKDALETVRESWNKRVSPEGE